MSALPLAVWASLAATTASYELGVRGELRAVTDSNPDAFGLDGAQEIDPSASGKLRVERWTLTGTYAPRIYWLEPQPSAAPALLQRVRLGFEAALGPGRRLSLTEDGAYGTNYFSPLGGSGGGIGPSPPPLTPLPSLPSVLTSTYVTSATTLVTDVAFDDEHRVSASAGYVVTGGPDRASQVGIPLLRSPRAELSMGYSPSRTETLTLSASALYGTFTNGALVSIGQVQGTYHWRLAQALDAEARLGAAAAQNHGAVGDTQTSAYPLAGAVLNTRVKAFDIPVAVQLAASAAPYLDVYTQYVYERGEADVGLGFGYDHWDLHAVLRGTMLLNGFNYRGETLAVLDVAASRALSHEVKAEVGLRGVLQEGVTVLGAPVQMGIFVSLTGVQRGGSND